MIIYDPVLHLKGRPARDLSCYRSTDVLHNFTVPQFRVKMDFVPGQVTLISGRSLTEPRQLRPALRRAMCGVGHYAMRGRVIVDSEEAYDAWLADQPTFAETQAELSTDLVAG